MLNYITIMFFIELSILSLHYTIVLFSLFRIYILFQNFYLVENDADVSVYLVKNGVSSKQ